MTDTRDELERLRARVAEMEQRETGGEEVSRSGGFVWRPRDDSVFWSRNATTIAGLEPEAGPDHLTDAIASMVHEEDLNRVVGETLALVHTRRLRELDFRIVRPDGEVRVLVANGRCMLDDAGGLEQVIGTLVDITEQRQAEEERSRAEVALTREREKLRELVSLLATTEERERQRLAALLHDEVTQLLAASRFQLELLAARIGEPYTEAFGELREMSEQALEATRNLTVELSPPVLQLGLAPALAWLADHFKSKRGVEVSFASAAEETALPSQSEMLLFVAARELVHNACKHAGPRASTRIELARSGSDVLLTVADDGVGMDPAVTPVTTSGYGLFSIRQRVESLGGHVAIDSQPDHGTRVTITFPVGPN